MTVEELRAEAKKLGYDIIKARKYIPHVKCNCGEHGEAWYNPDGFVIKCKDRDCPTRTKTAKTERAAWILWYELNTGEKFKEVK